ncbi:MAG: thiopurine S-methyltransferase [Bdellovibrionota bacterium]
MENSYWKKKWETGDIRFHQDGVHPPLIKNANLFPAGKIVVPLCGKSRDLLYLSSQGHEVTGIELSAIACNAFFDENEIPFKQITTGDFIVYQSEKISIWCGDFFKTPKEVFSGISGIYDRAALVALPKEMRIDYVKYILSQTTELSNLGILLFTFEYQDPEIKGPPFSVDRIEVEELLGSKFKIKEIFSETNGDFVKNHPRLQSRTVTEKGYWLSEK